MAVNEIIVDQDIMMKKLLKILCYVFVCMIGVWCSCCKDDNECEIFGIINGRITDDETGDPIAGATVTLTVLSESEQTKEDGAFCFEELDPGQYTLLVQKSGYYQNTKTLEVLSGKPALVIIPLRKIETEK